ncbi:Hpt domain-containing protein, partial [Helicobacter bizzozeronii]|uniref:Hpt domain-containing protein n=1 Tax=Helicobacter bizzozeronii TaxID=56877 RepID=UPI001F217321
MDDMKEIMEDFLVEAFEMNEQLDQDLVELEHNPQDLDLLNRIFRVAHTIKGSSSFLNLDILTHLTHNMEDVLNKARKGELIITPDVMDVVLRSVDMMKTLLVTIRDTGSDANSGIDTTNIVKELQAIAHATGGGDETPPLESAPSEPSPPPPPPPSEPTESAPIAQPTTPPSPDSESEPDYANMSTEEVEKEIDRLLKLRQEADKKRRAELKKEQSQKAQNQPQPPKPQTPKTPEKPQ